MPLYRNKNWLRNKYINEKLIMVQIAKLCDISISTIYNWLKKHNIPIRSKSEAQHLACGNYCDLSKEAIEWINGELLGDGCLRLNSKYSAKFNYTSKHREYIEYVSNILNSFGIKQSGKIYKRYHKDMDCYTYQYSSRAYPELLTIRKKWYPGGKKIVPKSIMLTSLTIRQWYIGDGSLGYQKNRKAYIVLHTNSFVTSDVEWLMEQLRHLGFKITRWANNIIRISVHSTKSFLDYISICPVECYQYKWRC